MVQFLLSLINIMKCLLFFLIFKHIPFLLCSIFYSPVFFTHTWKCSFLVTGSQRPSPAVMCLLWLKLPRKNNQCHCGVPYHQYTSWTARTTTASPLLVAPFGLYRWGTLSKHFLHHKLNGNTFKSQCNIRFSGSEASPQDDQSYGSKESLPPHYGRWNLVNCRLSSWTSISVLLNSFSSFLIAALSAGVSLAQGLSARRS